MREDTPNIFTLRECSYSYGSGDFRLDNVSIDMSSKRMYGIVGPNGSGKSTLLRIMAGITVPEGGQVSVKGKELKDYSRRAFARNVAFLPQSPSPSFDLSVRDVVSLGRYPHQSGLGLISREDERVIKRTLKETECEHFADRLFSTLSGGEKQRVMVAGVLAQEPSAVLLDEPGASLDLHHKSHIFDLLWSLSRSGLTVVVVTHDLNLAGEYCDELILISSGRVARSGCPEEVMDAGLLSEVYGADLQVIEHPLTGSPLVNVVGKKGEEEC